MTSAAFSGPRPAASLAPATGAPARRLRADADRLHAAGFAGLVLDAARPGLDPSDLGASARRDIIAMLRRRELELAAIDAFVPVERFADPATADPAVRWLVDVIALAADLGRIPVAVRLAGAGGASTGAVDSPAIASPPSPGGLIVPPGVLAEPDPPAGPHAGSDDDGPGPAHSDVRAALVAAAEHRGVALVDHGPDAARGASAGMSFGLDAAACLAAGRDPLAVLATVTDDVALVRLSDLTADGRRVPPGDAEGRVDLGGLAAAAAMLGAGVPVVIDPRQWNDPWGGIEVTARRWTEACG